MRVGLDIVAAVLTQHVVRAGDVCRQSSPRGSLLDMFQAAVVTCGSRLIFPRRSQMCNDRLMGLKESHCDSPEIIRNQENMMQ